MGAQKKVEREKEKDSIEFDTWSYGKLVGNWNSDERPWEGEAAP